MNKRRMMRVRVIYVVALFFVLFNSAGLVAQTSGAPSPSSNASQKSNTATNAMAAGKPVTIPRDQYRINLTLDFDGRTFNGTERVRWTNRHERPTSILYFHLYANHRGGNTKDDSNPSRPPRVVAAAAASAPVVVEGAESMSANLSTHPLTASDEPRLEVSEVRAAATGQALAFSSDDGGVTMRVQLREAVAPNSMTEIDITFKGSLPEIGADETSLPAHVIQQIGAALRDTREWRRARDMNFASRGVMLLGSIYPVLAVREGDDWQRKVEASVGDIIHNEPSDYQVTIKTPPNVAVFTSAETLGGRAGGGDSSSSSNHNNSATNTTTGTAAATMTGGGTVEHFFAGENLRSLAIIAGKDLRFAERAVSGVRVRSIYLAEHEATGRRVLGIASDAVKIFAARFGALPFKTVNVTEAPLVAGLGSAEFSGLGVIASAYYVDFDSPATRNLPEIVREQRASVEDSLEFAVAHMMAHQWWGASVGNDPERVPVLDESLAHWSALQYYKEAHGDARAAQALDDQLRGVYQVYRTFGGEDMAADRTSREYRNSFQYAALVSSKGALMFTKLQTLLGEEHFWKALRSYYEANKFENAELDDLEAAFAAEVPVNERRAVTRTFKRWLSEKRGDEDIAPPNPQLAAALGLSVEHGDAKDRNAFSRLGRFFWRQMTRIR